MITIHQCHIDALAKQDLINLEFCQFKDDTKDALCKAREGLECLNLSLNDLPNTITIDATQVSHANWDAKNDVPSRTIEDSINHHRGRIDDMNIQTTNEIKRVIQLVSDQKEEELLLRTISGRFWRG